MKKDQIITDNTNKVEDLVKKLTNSKSNEYVKLKLPNYLSNALRNSHYYGNLRIKYVGFNFSFIVFFVSILTLYISLLTFINPSLWLMVVPILIGLAFYLIYFLRLFQKKYDTISFSHKGLSHYKSFMDMKDYPKITDQPCKYKKLVDKYSIENDLKQLLQLYFYQANYNRVGLKVRRCLIIGIIDLFVSILISFGILIWLIWLSSLAG